MTKIIVLTAEPENFVPERLKEEADKAGHQCEVVDITKTFVVETTDGPKVMYSAGEDSVAHLEPPFVCIPRLNEHGLEYKLALLHRLELQGAVMLNTAASMALCNDKLGSQVVLNSAKIKTPYSVAVAKPTMLDAAVKEIEAAGKLKFPMIIKTMRGTHGIGVMKVDSRASLMSVTQAMLAHGHDLMLQEFIEHEKSARIIMIGDELLAANLRGQPKDKDEFRTNSHLGSETEKYEPSEEELALARRIVELFGCRFCAIDYIVVKEELIVLEVNGSPGLEAIQKDWEGDKNLPAEVIRACVALSGEQPSHTYPGTAVDSPDEHVVIVSGEEPPPDQPEDEPTTQDPLADIEPVALLRLTRGPVDGRIDSGAAYCSVHANDVSVDEGWVKFERDGVKYKVQLARTIKIRNSHGLTRRPVIKLDVEVRNQRYNDVEFTVSDRANMSYEVLIGRNLLKMLGIPILIPADEQGYEQEEE